MDKVHERSVGTIKQLMRKAAEEGRDVHLALLEYCNTPISGLESVFTRTVIDEPNG